MCASRNPDDSEFVVAIVDYFVDGDHGVVIVDPVQCHRLNTLSVRSRLDFLDVIDLEAAGVDIVWRITELDTVSERGNLDQPDLADLQAAAVDVVV